MSISLGLLAEPSGVNSIPWSSSCAGTIWPLGADTVSSTCWAETGASFASSISFFNSAISIRLWISESMPVAPRYFLSRAFSLGDTTDVKSGLRISDNSSCNLRISATFSLILLEYSFASHAWNVSFLYISAFILYFPIHSSRYLILFCMPSETLDRFVESSFSKVAILFVGESTAGVAASSICLVAVVHIASISTSSALASFLFSISSSSLARLACQVSTLLAIRLSTFASLDLSNVRTPLSSNMFSKSARSSNLFPPLRRLAITSLISATFSSPSGNLGLGVSLTGLGVSLTGLGVSLAGLGVFGE